MGAQGAVASGDVPRLGSGAPWLAAIPGTDGLAARTERRPLASRETTLFTDAERGRFTPVRLVAVGCTCFAPSGLTWPVTHKSRPIGFRAGVLATRTTRERRRDRGTTHSHWKRGMGGGEEVWWVVHRSAYVQRQQAPCLFLENSPTQNKPAYHNTPHG